MEILGNGEAEMREGWRGSSSRSHRFWSFWVWQLNLSSAQNGCQCMQVAILDGITMGGGAGISVHGSFRIATDKTVTSQ